jgi:hypothetical protein
MHFLDGTSPDICHLQHHQSLSKMPIRHPAALYFLQIVLQAGRPSPVQTYLVDLPDVKQCLTRSTSAHIMRATDMTPRDPLRSAYHNIENTIVIRMLSSGRRLSGVRMARRPFVSLVDLFAAII